jgi:hypothetical protein
LNFWADSQNIDVDSRSHGKTYEDGSAYIIELVGSLRNPKEYY